MPDRPTLLDSLGEAIRDERLSASVGISMDIDAFIAALKADGFIIVRNPEPSEHGFSCHVCGCEYPPR